MADQTCPVCQMTVNDVTAPSAVHEGRRYAFCSANCQRAFQRHPANFAARAAA